MKCFVLAVCLVLINQATGAAWDNTQAHCPGECVCQHAHFNDLAMSRWVNHVQSKQQAGKHERGLKMEDVDDEETLVNSNEASYDGDTSFLANPFVKQATCILQADMEAKELVEKLPYDVQALVLLYTGQGRNKTVTTSALNVLNELSTLEIRGPLDFTLKLIIDEPLSFLQHANFESIQLLGSENLKRPETHEHPAKSFDYVPNSEKSDASLTLKFETPDVEEIAPYEVYIKELKKSRTATFYGWEHLEVLRIHHSKMDEIHYEMFQGLENLRHLSLEHNGIKIVPDFAVYGALHLRTLSLAHNNILDLQYRALAGLFDLEVLDLSHNSLSKLSEFSFPPFPKLEYVDFRHNPIRYIFPSTFAVMNYTRTMHIGSGEELQLDGNNPFESLELLKYLSISNVSITTLDQTVFKGLANLEILKVRGSVRRIEFDAFVDMPNLQELDLSHCGIRDISMDAFIGCKKLEIIDLSHNNLSYIPPGLCDDQTNLLELYLQSNSLRYLPTTFFQHPTLKLVRLLDNPWKCSCEMATWNPKVTNQARGVEKQRCVRDFHTREIISCKRLGAYKFDNKLSPRCANHNQRSVFYAIRKDMRCSTKKTFRPTQAVSTPGVRTSKIQNLQERRDRYKEKLNRRRIVAPAVQNSNERSNEQVFNREMWRQRQTRKFIKTRDEMNSVFHHKQDEGSDVFGRPEDHFSYNYI